MSHVSSRKRRPEKMGQRKGARGKEGKCQELNMTGVCRFLSNLVSRPFVFLLEVRYNFSTSREKKKATIEY